MPNFETAEGRRIRQRFFCVFANVAAKLALQNSFEERSHFVLFARGLELDPAVGKVADPACDVVALCYVPDRVTEADALNITFVKDLNGCRHASED